MLKKQRQSSHRKLMPELELVPSSHILLTEAQTTGCTELVQYKMW